MKKIICLVLVFAMLFSGCSKWNVEIVDPTKPIENDSELVVPEEEKEENMPVEGQKEQLETEQEEFIIPLAGDYAYSVLEIPEEFGYSYFFEFGEKLLFVGKNIYCFDAESGKLIYEAKNTSETIIDAEEYSEKEGFDYRMVLAEGVLYRSSEDPEKELFEKIPEGKVYETYGKINYDINEENFVFEAKEGVMLADKNGENEKMVLDNELLWNLKSVLPNFEWNQEFGNPFYFGDPHFILGGTKIASTVFSWEGIEQGFVVYDIEEDEIEFGRFCPEPWIPFYPVDDRYVIVHGSWVFTGFYDTETEKFSEYRFDSGVTFDDDYGTYDFKSVIAVDYNHGNDDPVDYTMMSSYLCTSETLDDRTKPFLRVTDNTTSAGIYAAGKKYAVISLSVVGREDTIYCVAKYGE